MRGGRIIKYGDPLAGGVARLRVEYAAAHARHGIVLDYAEARMLLDELQRGIAEIDSNRAKATSYDQSPTDPHHGGKVWA
mgnify:FL=1